ncbi:GAF domain-containing protein [Sphingomonas morindae]|uniref:GAF domain-containing protein n=1 Tax=Sphingomonas morindae TaxID=1541170 RepID=A0ABY4XDL4_9SPHN|nr:GAF domain-containing protein [Sphingomonas morindae]USI74939.1 GAF domain-containing protein [Sphingomonas morindae]
MEKRVFYCPAPFPDDEAERQAVVAALLRQSGHCDAVRDLVAQAREMFAATAGALTILDEGRQWLACAIGLAIASTPRCAAFCGYTIRQDAPFCVPDAHLDERFSGNPLVTGDLGLRFYAGAPVRIHGQAVGALCVMDQRAQAQPPQARLAALRRLADTAGARLEALLDTPAPMPMPAIVPFPAQREG